MKIRLYLDEDGMADGLVQALSIRGVDITTANLEEMVNRIDADHLDYATSQGHGIECLSAGFITRLKAIISQALEERLGLPE